MVIRHALNNFLGVLSSTFGSRSMVKCFEAARDLELQAERQDLEKIILRRTVKIAKGEFRCEMNIRLQETPSDHSAFSF